MSVKTERITVIFKGDKLDYLFTLILIVLALSIIGDIWFIRKLRSGFPEAFTEAGKPNIWIVGLLFPMISSRYSAFIIFRKYRHFLPPGTKLRLIANLLYTTHVALISLVGLTVLLVVID